MGESVGHYAVDHSSVTPWLFRFPDSPIHLRFFQEIPDCFQVHHQLHDTLLNPTDNLH